MNVHIIPHGRATDHVTRGLRSFPNVQVVYLLTSDAFLDTGAELENTLTQFGYETYRKEIDAFELRNVVDTIVNIARDHRDEDLAINITGGTNLVAGASTSSAFFVGATPYYVLEPQTGNEPIDELVMRLPAPAQPLTFEIDGLQRDVFETLVIWDREGNTGVILREIGDEIGEAPQKISYHIKQLEKQGLVRIEPDGRTKQVYVTDLGRLYYSWTA